MGGTITRFDPRIQPAPTEFDTRDTIDPEIRIRKVSENIGSSDFLTEFQSLPLGFASWGEINAFARFHCHIKLAVSGSAPPASTTIPLFGEPPPAPVLKPYRFSNPNLWGGIWDGEKVTVSISVTSAGLLDVTVTERQAGQPDFTYEARNVPIPRILAYPLRDIQNAVLRPLDNETRNQVLKALDEREDSRGYFFEVQNQSGDGRFETDLISADHQQYSNYREIGLQFAGELEAFRPQEMGGDFLKLPNDAPLEIYKLVSEGRIIG